MFCPNCGKNISDETIYCPYCGRSVANDPHGYNPNYNQGYNQGYAPNTPPYAPVKEDKVSVGFCILSYFVPIVGIILWIVWHKETPKKARACGITAIIAWVINFIMTFIMSFVFAKLYYDIINDLLHIMPMIIK